jgi:hypothetical protein
MRTPESRATMDRERTNERQETGGEAGSAGEPAVTQRRLVGRPRLPGAPCSRQLRWQEARIARGRCGLCGKRRLDHYGWACDRCVLARRRRRRKLSGGRPWMPGGRGRPPRISERVPLSRVRETAAW